MMNSLRLFLLFVLLVWPAAARSSGSVPGPDVPTKSDVVPTEPVVVPTEPAADPAPAAPASLDTAPLSVSGHFAAGVQVLSSAREPSDYLAAASHFQAILDLGVIHEDVYYNLGNANFQLNRLGPAVYYFEKALTIHPGHNSARYNLALTRQLLAQKYKDEIVQMDRQSTWVRLVTAFSDGTITAVFLVFWILLFSVLMALYFVQKPLVRLTLITAAVILGLGSAVFGTLLAGREIHDRTTRYAIVLPDEVEVREAPQASANRAFVLHAGHRVLTGASERAWVKILLPNGMEGWLERRDLGLL